MQRAAIDLLSRVEAFTDTDWLAGSLYDITHYEEDADEELFDLSESGKTAEYDARLKEIQFQSQYTIMEARDNLIGLYDLVKDMAKYIAINEMKYKNAEINTIPPAG